MVCFDLADALLSQGHFSCQSVLLIQLYEVAKLLKVVRELQRCHFNVQELHVQARLAILATVRPAQ